jgi:hypothetical protein
MGYRMIVLLDVNVVLDVLGHLEPHHQAADVRSAKRERRGYWSD